MEMGSGDQFENLLFLKDVRNNCETAYTNNPYDANNLMKWGGCLIELTQFEGPEESTALLEEAVLKLKEALEVDPNKHHAMWCLGQAYMAHAFLISDIEEARPYFNMAGEYFAGAAQNDPVNEMYEKSLDMVAKAPQLHAEIHNVRGFGASSSASSKPKTTTKKKESAMYDIMGWVILAVGVAVWFGYAKNHMPPPPLT